MSIARALGITVLLLSACAPPDDALVQSSLEAAPAGSVYYTVRPDLRLCMWPFCGGVWIHAINSDQTKCAGGTIAAECYVAKLETPVEVGDVTALVVRGTLVSRTQPDLPSYFALHADGVWEAQTGMPRKGAFWLAGGHGGQFEVSLLNDDQSQQVHGVDLTGASPSPDQVAAAIAALEAGRLIVAGTIETGGDGSMILRATQFYLRLNAPSDNVYEGWKVEVQK